MSAMVTLALAAAVAGVAFIFVAPASWFTWVFGAAVGCCLLFATVAHAQTKTEPPANPLTRFVLFALNFPEQPMARVKSGWALAAFLVSAAFAISLAVAVIARAYA